MNPESNTSATTTTISFIKKLLIGYQGCNFTVKLWDGTVLESKPGTKSLFSVVFKHPGAVRSLFFPPSEMRICEAYFKDDFDIEGDILALLENAEQLSVRNWKLKDFLHFILDVLRLPKDPRSKSGTNGGVALAGEKYTTTRDKEAVQFHYDVSNDFYSLWLDERMVYSGAYFYDENESLSQSQLNKLDIICKKLQLKPGDKYLDIGCGWGALLFHAVQNYGVDGTGVTLSKNQATFINTKAARLGLSDRMHVEMRDYRELPAKKQFDKLSSVEMLHHVGEKKLPHYFTHLKNLLKDDGMSFHLVITSNAAKGKYKGPAYADKYFMPDYQLIPVSKYGEYAEAAGWEIIDTENLRKHYMLTAAQWLHQMEEKHEEAAKLCGEVVFRAWRLSFALMSFGFKHNLIQMHHLLLAKNPKGSYSNPINRSIWYKE